MPFKEECFGDVFSSHTIEHIKKPKKMLQELLRVSNHQVITRCPHRKGSGAKRPFHINYLDEEWFNASLAKLGFKPNTFVSNSECLITSRPLLHSAVHCSGRLLPYVEASIAYRVMRKIERSQSRLRFPYEVEVQVLKQETKHEDLQHS